MFAERLTWPQGLLSPTPFHNSAGSGGNIGMMREWMHGQPTGQIRFGIPILRQFMISSLPVAICTAVRHSEADRVCETVRVCEKLFQ
jgi:hypothetical protein